MTGVQVCNVFVLFRSIQEICAYMYEFFFLKTLEVYLYEYIHLRVPQKKTTNITRFSEETQ